MRRWLRQDEGATLLEFGIILPIALTLLLGIAEGARFVSEKQAVTTATREAARYGSTIGVTDGLPHFADCAAIRSRATESTPFELVDTDVLITYDTGPASTQVGLCPTTGPLADPDAIESGDRIVVTVSKPFTSSLPFIGNVFNMEISATDHRTIVKGDL
ncbi:MAG: pilus assembly protein [Acidimicrobiia bacterium]|nr:pilus assembly protein [Acidimicrobiia bacterium]